MIRLIRILGYLLFGAGALVLLAYLIQPLRALWPWLRSLPWPIQFGLGAALAGLLILIGSMIWERMEDLDAERSFDDDL